MNDLVPNIKEIVLEYFCKSQGFDEEGLIIRNYNEEPIKQYKNNVLSIEIETNFGDIGAIMRSFHSGKYSKREEEQIQNEIYFSEYMPRLMSENQFPGLPAFIKKVGEGKNTVIFQRKVGNFTLAEWMSPLSQEARDLEKKIYEDPLKKLPIHSVDQEVLKELDIFERINYAGFDVELKKKFERLLSGDRKIHIPSKDRIHERVFEAIMAHMEKGTHLVKYNQELNKVSMKNIRYSIQKARNDFWKDVGRIVDYQVKEKRVSLQERINKVTEPDFKIDYEILKDLVNHNFLPRFINQNMPWYLVHGDANCTNIALGEGGYNGVYIIDEGHRKLVQNPLYDVADNLTYQNLFCGLSQRKQEDMWERALDRTRSPTYLRYVTELSRNLKIIGTLTKRISELEPILDESDDPKTKEINFLYQKENHLAGMKYRLPKYLELTKQQCLNLPRKLTDLSKPERQEFKVFGEYIYQILDNIKY